jgi:hypothetical protein
MLESPFSVIHSQTCFHTLTTLLNKEFYNPDIEALEIVLAACVAHPHLKLEPVWLFVVGPSGSGKTSMTIQAAMGIPNAILVGDVTSKTFLSAWSGKKDHDCSLLSRIGSHGIILMKDFTTVISKRPEERGMVAAQLREIYDGTFVKSTGMGTHQTWSGKITLIAASTPALEREWGLMRDLGERFMTVRWSRGDGIATARAAYRQSPDTGRQLRILSAKYVSEADKELPSIPEDMIERIYRLAEITAISRAKVVRTEASNNRQIVDVPEPEAPTRISRCLTTLISAHAALHRRPVIPEDIRIAIRVAMDSIPIRRYQILANIPRGAGIQLDHLQTALGRAKSTVKWNLEELQVLGLLEKRVTNELVEYWFTRELEDLWDLAFPQTTSLPPRDIS